MFLTPRNGNWQLHSPETTLLFDELIQPLMSLVETSVSISTELEAGGIVSVVAADGYGSWWTGDVISLRLKEYNMPHVRRATNLNFIDVSSTIPPDIHHNDGPYRGMTAKVTSLWCRHWKNSWTTQSINATFSNCNTYETYSKSDSRSTYMLPLWNLPRT